jgi:hypothetical protein
MDNNNRCDKILRVFIECATIDKNGKKSHMKSKCEEIEKMLDSTWITAYLDCVKKQTNKTNKI